MPIQNPEPTRFRVTAPATRRPRCKMPELECLEARRLLTGTDVLTAAIQYDGEVIQGTQTAAELIRLNDPAAALKIIQGFGQGLEGSFEALGQQLTPEVETALGPDWYSSRNDIANAQPLLSSSATILQQAETNPDSPQSAVQVQQARVALDQGYWLVDAAQYDLYNLQTVVIDDESGQLAPASTQVPTSPDSFGELPDYLPGPGNASPIPPIVLPLPSLIAQVPPSPGTNPNPGSQPPNPTLTPSKTPPKSHDGKHTPLPRRSPAIPIIPPTDATLQRVYHNSSGYRSFEFLGLAKQVPAGKFMHELQKEPFRYFPFPITKSNAASTNGPILNGHTYKLNPPPYVLPGVLRAVNVGPNSFTLVVASAGYVVPVGSKVTFKTVVDAKGDVLLEQEGTVNAAGALLAPLVLKLDQTIGPPTWAQQAANLREAFGYGALNNSR